MVLISTLVVLPLWLALCGAVVAGTWGFAKTIWHSCAGHHAGETILACMAIYLMCIAALVVVAYWPLVYFGVWADDPLFSLVRAFFATPDWP